MDALCLAQLGYVIVGSVWMLAGFGGPSVTHYVGLLSDGPAAFAAIVVIAVAARHAPAGPLRAGWSALAIALALYLVGEIIGVSSWLRGHDPFPGPADAFYSSFYPLLMAAALCLIRAAAVRVPWAHLSLDAAIFVVGFGAFFWYPGDTAGCLAMRKSFSSSRF